MDQSCTISLTSTTPFLLGVLLSLLVSECQAKCKGGDSLGRGCGCTGPGCITEMGQVIGLICGILGAGIIFIATCLYCLIVGRRLPKCCKTHCCQTFNPNYETDMPTRHTFAMSRSQWDRNDVQITSSQDGSQATKYTLSWSVDDFYGDIPVKAFNLKFRKVEVMPNGVDGDYRILYYVDSTDRGVDNLPATERTHTLTGLQPNSFYSLKLTSIYGNKQRKTKTFIFKTAKDRNDVQITSSSDASEATSYTLTWSVDDNSGDVPVKAFNLNFKRVEVMPDRVDGEYRLRRNLDLTDRSVDNLPPTNRAYTLTGLQPNSFYILTLTTIYGNLHSQRMTNTFIFKTAEVQTEDQSYAAYHTHEYENGVNPSVSNSRNGYITESSDNYQIEHTADPTDNRFLDNRIGSQVVHGAEYLSDSDYNKNLYNYSDPPPSYYEATKTSNITETSI